jgi:phosphoribosylformylglycinamidine synthase
VGATFKELGGSHYYASHGAVGSSVPKVNAEKGKQLMNALAAATQKGFVKACHDLSEGGIGVAAAEMAFAGGLGMQIDLTKMPLAETIERDDFILFSESNSRFLVEVAPEHKSVFEKVLKGVVCADIGQVTKEKKLEITGRDGKVIVNANIDGLKEAWQKTLRW